MVWIGLMGCGERGQEPVCYATPPLGLWACELDAIPWHGLPLKEGAEAVVMQGIHGETSHGESMAHAVDLSCREGDTVVASRAGVVWAVREDSASGCGDRACQDQANYIVLDHGDGTYSEYQHLQYMGVLVEEGDQVCAGQAVGLCGITGYTTGPHLHFAVFDAARQTIPVRFREAAKAQRGWGLVVPGARYRSENRRQVGCEAVEASRLGRLAFAHQGIVLEAELPTVFDGRDRVKIAGRYHGALSHVAVVMRREGGVEEAICAPVEADGRFVLEWSWERFSGGVYLFMLTGANERCEHTGSAWAYHLSVSGPSVGGEDPRTIPKR
jgi:hypothetical protein